MLKVIKKIKFSRNENRMKDNGNIHERLKYFKEGKNKNLRFVLKKRFEWMNKYINKDDVGLEVGSGPGFSKEFIINKSPKRTKKIDIEKLSRQVNFELASYETIYEKVKSDINRIRHIPSIRPVSGGFLNSSFGYRQDPIDNIRRFHQGQDITVASGTPIFSPADGAVKRAYYIGGFGNHIKLEHSSGYSTTYAHLSKIFVRHGQKIKRGDIIGETGNTGRSTAPHLHYEVHYRGTPKNPLDYFFTQAGN